MKKEPDPKYFIPNYSGKLRDKRLDVRANQLAKQLSQTPCSSVRKVATTQAEHKAHLRLLNNDRVEEEALIEEAASRVSHMVDSRDVLVISDTSEINLLDHKNRL